MSVFSQVFPPEPTFTDKSLPSLAEKVFIVTGSASGVGIELAKILFSKNVTVHIGARSLDRANAGIQAIKEAVTFSTGRLVPVVIDLADCRSVKVAADNFIGSETALHPLVHNAAVMAPPEGSRNKYERRIRPHGRESD